jgi:hypothetical protein
MGSSKMFETPNSRDIVKYVMSKQGIDGGYLSYQYMGIFESSVEDTYYALITFKLLGVNPPNISKTIDFLKKAQSTDGSYSSLRVAYFAIKALTTFHEKPKDVNGSISYLKNSLKLMLNKEYDSFQQLVKFERKNYITKGIEENVLKSVDLYNLYIIEIPTLLCNIHMVTSALNLLGYQLSELERENIIRLVLKFKNEDGGFGLNASYIDETFHALSILMDLKGSLNDLNLKDTIKWIYDCENHSGGFKVKPDIPYSYSLEYTYYGLQIMNLLDIEPLFPKAHVNFIYSCYNPNGGFRRSVNLGISTLEDTFYAVSSLARLNVVL